MYFIPIMVRKSILASLVSYILTISVQALWELAERLGDVKPRGLKEEDLAKLPTRTYRKRPGDKDTDECRVCLTAYKSGEKLALLACKHEYHIDCIKEWLKVSRRFLC